MGLQDITAALRRDAAPLARALPRARWSEVAALGYDERFRRLWDLYLAYCEAGFRERRIGDVQLLLAKPRWRGDIPAPAAAPAVAAAMAPAEVVEPEELEAA